MNTEQALREAAETLDAAAHEITEVRASLQHLEKIAAMLAGGVLCDDCGTGGPCQRHKIAIGLYAEWMNLND